MKIKTLLIISAIILVVFGLAFAILPGQLLELYGNPVDAPMKYLGQLFGAALIALAVLTWAARNSPDNEARRAIALALFLGHGVGFVVALIGQLGEVVNALGWFTVAIYFFISIGFGYFRFVKTSYFIRIFTLGITQDYLLLSGVDSCQF